MKSYAKSIINILKYMAIYFIVLIVIVSVYFWIHLNCPRYTQRILGWLLTISFLGLWLALKKDNLFTRCNFTMIHWKDIIYPILVVGGFDFLIIFLDIHCNFLPNVPNDPDIIKLTHSNQFLAFLVLNLMGPIFEEIFYRGMIFNERRHGFSNITAI